MATAIDILARVSLALAKEIADTRNQIRSAAEGMERNPDDDEWDTIWSCLNEQLAALRRVEAALHANPGT